jgi:3'(2'), 5'-bisphosphate nucleotidase
VSQDLLKIAISAALEAAKEILKIYLSDDFEVQLKSDDSPLTKADLVSHQVIESYLKPTNIPILSEEGKDISYDERKDWAQLWIVDPIDGTKEFIKRNGEFTVNIALIENQKPILGVVYAPVLNELYFSSIELGGFKVSVDLSDFDVNNLIDSAVKLPLSREDKTYTIVASRSHLSDETVDFIEELKKEKGDVHLISKGSSLKLCLVAEGSADCYPRFAPTMEWDTAAGQAICEHAGFRVIDWETKEDLLYNRPKLLNNWFIVN